MPTSKAYENGLDRLVCRSEYLRLSKIDMARECDISGARPKRGGKIHRRGLAKKKGGIGMHVTKATPRWHFPNLKTKRVWVPELKKFVTVKATARAFKTLSKNGTYKTLAKAGVVH
ncbi:MAG TPA: 50S ribosomal protein L28 [Terrimicrobiaceae bacterium]